MKTKAQELGMTKFPFYPFEGKELYHSVSDGYWAKDVYDDNGNTIYYENSDGYWIKRKHDEDSTMVYHEDSDGSKEYTII